jgi:hypothetical protein
VVTYHISVVAQQSDNASWSLKPWAGTVEQLGRAAQLCVDRIAEDDDKPPKVQIGIVEHDGYQRALGAIDDLTALPPEDLGRIKSMDITIGSGGGYSPVSAKIEVESEGLAFRVSGKHRTWTAGLRHELNAVLAPSLRLRPIGITNSDWLPVVIAPLWIVLVLVVGAILELTTLSSGTKIPFEVGIPTVTVGFYGVVAFVLPGIELLASGAQPKYQRWKGSIISAAVALVIAVAAGLIVALAQ